MSSAYDSLSILRAPYQISLAQTLSEPEQQIMVSLLRLLPADCIDNIQLDDITVESESIFSANSKSATIDIKNMVDGRGLACPMPLLKTKVALRNVAIGESLYVVATDPNSQADITAFCQQTQQARAANPLLLLVNQATNSTTSQSSADAELTISPDTIYHFIITKTDSN